MRYLKLRILELVWVVVMAAVLVYPNSTYAWRVGSSHQVPQGVSQSCTIEEFIHNLSFEPQDGSGADISVLSIEGFIHNLSFEQQNNYIETLDLETKEYMVEYILSKLVFLEENRLPYERALFVIFFEMPRYVDENNPSEESLVFTLPMCLREEWINKGYHGYAEWNGERSEFTFSNNNPYFPRIFPRNPYFILLPGENKISFNLFDSSGKQVIKSEYTFVAHGIMYTSQGVTLILERRAQEIEDRILEEICSTVATMNLFLPETDKIREITIKNNPSGGGAWNFGGTISIDSGCFQYGDRGIITTVWHEAAHIFAEHLKDEHEDYWSEFNSFFERGKGRGLLHLFKESEYMPEIPSEWGHPDSNPSELFASASIIIRYFQKEFQEKVNLLSDPEDRELAKQIALMVAQAYLGIPDCPVDMFNPEFIGYLELNQYQLRRLSAASLPEAQEFFSNVKILSDEVLARIFIQTRLGYGDIYFEPQLWQRFNVVFSSYDTSRKESIYGQVITQIDKLAEICRERISTEPVNQVAEIFNNSSTRTLLIGDHHFYYEDENFILNVLEKILGENMVTIALEIPHDMQDEVDRFLSTPYEAEAEEIINKIRQSNPIVLNSDHYANMLWHLRELSLAGMDMNVICMDVTLEEQRQHGQIYRENFMFSTIKNYLEKNPEKKMLIFVGCQHIVKSPQREIDFRTGQVKEYWLGYLLNQYLIERGQKSISVMPYSGIGYLLQKISNNPFGMFVKDLPIELYAQGNIIWESYDYVVKLS